MNRKAPSGDGALEVAPLGFWCAPSPMRDSRLVSTYLQDSTIFRLVIAHLHISVPLYRYWTGNNHGGSLHAAKYRHTTLAGAFDRRDLKPTSNQQDRAGSPTGREIQGHETAKNLCRTAIANVSNGVNRHAPGGKDYMYSLLKRSLDY